MPSRIRPILLLQGMPRTGGAARVTLEEWCASYGKVPQRGSMPEADRLIKMLGMVPTPKDCSLLICREPRRVEKNRSRYIAWCEWLGVPARTKKKKKLVVRNLRPTLDSLREEDLVPELAWENATIPTMSNPIPGRGAIPSQAASLQNGSTWTWSTPNTALRDILGGAGASTVQARTPPQTVFGRDIQRIQWNPPWEGPDESF